MTIEILAWIALGMLIGGGLAWWLIRVGQPDDCDCDALMLDQEDR